jgi:hypothetical protein
MAMQMLSAAGVPIVSDGLREPGEDNPRGFLEDSRVKALHKEGETGEWLAEAKGTSHQDRLLLPEIPAGGKRLHGDLLATGSDRDPLVAAEDAGTAGEKATPTTSSYTTSGESPPGRRSPSGGFPISLRWT